MQVKKVWNDYDRGNFHFFKSFPNCLPKKWLINVFFPHFHVARLLPLINRFCVCKNSRLSLWQTTIYLNHIDLCLCSIIFILEKLNFKLHSYNVQWYNDTALHHRIHRLSNDLKERRETFLYSTFDFVFAFNIKD